jgi:hypothetical protein
MRKSEDQIGNSRWNTGSIETCADPKAVTACENADAIVFSILIQVGEPFASQ